MKIIDAVGVGCRFVISLTAGFVGIFAGGFLGAVVGRFVSGEQGLHGFGMFTLVCMIGGAIIGLFTGVKLGTSLGFSLTAAGRNHEKSVEHPATNTPTMKS